MDEQTIRNNLPIPPYRYKYVIAQQSPQIWRVDLLHPNHYNYKTEQIVTIHSFIKVVKGVPMVYPPHNSIKPRRTSLCGLQDIPDSCSYTTIIPTKRVITD